MVRTALIRPKGEGSQLADVSFCGGLCGVVVTREKNRLLDVGCQEQKIHDLGQPGTSDESEPGQVGVVAHLATVDHVLKLDCERHQARDSWNARRFGQLGPGGAMSVVALSASRRGNAYFDLQRPIEVAHRTASF
jgi:hypothetical protein